MLTTEFYKKFTKIALCAVAVSLTSFAQANDFYAHPNYQNFKLKTMQTYGLTEQQIDWAMNGSKNLPNIINIMNLLNCTLFYDKY